MKLVSKELGAIIIIILYCDIFILFGWTSEESGVLAVGYMKRRNPRDLHLFQTSDGGIHNCCLDYTSISRDSGVWSFAMLEGHVNLTCTMSAYLAISEIGYNLLTHLEWQCLFAVIVKYNNSLLLHANLPCEHSGKYICSIFTTVT